MNQSNPDSEFKKNEYRKIDLKPLVENVHLNCVVRLMIDANLSVKVPDFFINLLNIKRLDF